MPRKPEEKTAARATAYQKLFLGDDGELTPQGKLVLHDLAKFCRLLSPTTVVNRHDGHIDPYATVHAEGRREVFLRVHAHLKLDLGVITRALKEVDHELAE